MREELFLSDLIGHDLADYVLCECYCLVCISQTTEVNNIMKVLILNKNGRQLFSTDLKVIEFLKRLQCYSIEVVNSDDIQIRRRLILRNNDTGFGYYLSRTATEAKIYSQAEIMRMIEAEDNPFCWKEVENLL